MSVRYRERFIKTGQYAEIEVFPVLEHPRARKRKFRPTTEAQELINQNAAERRFIRIIHENFTDKDYRLELTYSDVYEPATYEQTYRDVQNFFRRLKRKYQKVNAELKYAYAIEEASRFHIHMFINGDIPREEIEQSWEMGYANLDPLQFDENGVKGYAKYIIKQRRGTRRWTTSKNLKKPQPVDKFVNRRVVKNYIENWNVQAYVETRFPDYQVVVDKSCCYTSDVTGFAYVRVSLFHKNARFSFYSTSLAEFDDRVKNNLKNRDVKSPPEEEWQQQSLWMLQ